MAFDCFLKIKDIPGESTDAAHKDWIELQSFQLGAHQNVSTASTGGARSTGRVNWSEAVATKTVDKASTKLFLALGKGTHIAECTVDICRATGEKQKYMGYKLEDVLISSVQNGGTGGGIATELVSFSFSSSLISSADAKGTFSSVSACGAASFEGLNKR